MADSDPGLFAQILGRAAYEFSVLQPMLPTYIHLIASALFPIYTGAHASLSRPSTAAKPTKKKKKDDVDGDDDEEDDDTDDEDEDEQRVMEGLSPTDAILMPLFAGTALASLYFLLKWMKDPALLNKLLNAYFAIFGVFSVSRLVADALDIGHSIIYPRRHVHRGALYHVDGKERQAVPLSATSTDKQPMTTPLPGFLANIPLHKRVRDMLWSDRAMPGNKWTLKLHLKRALAAKFKFGPHDLVGLAVALAAVAYFNLVDKPWYLTNLLGFAFSYGALQLMSPTTFATGSLILSTLFFYDIYFVFYTQSLDVPIKLLFPRPGPVDDPTQGPSYAMLGLGDVVLPGIMIGLALRFDLYLFYLRQQKRIPAATQGEEDIIQKPRYQSLAGRWTDHFWTHSLTGRPLWTASKLSDSESEVPFTFPKTYFRASLAGYILGLLATLGVMMVWNHAQPALLYLVPGVLGSIWFTALVRGEINLMCQYTEEIEEEENSKTTGNDKEAKSPANSVKDKQDNLPANETGGKKSAAVKENQHDGRAKSRRPARELFSFSIEAPPLHKDAKPAENKVDVLPDAIDEKHNWAPSKNVSRATGAEPVGKRVRLR
ncbi:similar to signal peptide peptidase [Plenodomus lingam JN3]|uniref:Similar to signal peptide peptidase n=1 Tax=Leptosphaeria maculans (strain JN3 / isolate v23.1.3 / race Av1-4-5-6-7-8) TaxID=985895 RepID=E4ZNQ8_LEPMJ|nr:similar to signal peptide peptidase [Plenodomus lingam JN3]CBX93277.1 similar to signal peptide peptidase [Plenodomus lingam JN3]